MLVTRFASIGASGPHENVCACEGRIVVAEENVVMYVGIYGGHELIAIAHVEHEAVNGHRAVYLVAQHVVELAQRDKALADVCTLVRLVWLYPCNEFQRIALREVGAAATLKGYPVVYLYVAGVHVAEVVALCDLHGSAVLIIVTYEVEHRLVAFTAQSITRSHCVLVFDRTSWYDRLIYHPCV